MKLCLLVTRYLFTFFLASRNIREVGRKKWFYSFWFCILYIFEDVALWCRGTRVRIFYRCGNEAKGGVELRHKMPPKVSGKWRREVS